MQEMNFPGKYRKMNSGKYLYKTAKKPNVTKEKTLMYFDESIVKIIAKFFDKLGDLESKSSLDLVEKLSKKKRSNDNVALKLFSDDTLNTKLSGTFLYLKL